MASVQQTKMCRALDAWQAEQRRGMSTDEGALFQRACEVAFGLGEACGRVSISGEYERLAITIQADYDGQQIDVVIDNALARKAARFQRRAAIWGKRLARVQDAEASARDERAQLADQLLVLRREYDCDEKLGYPNYILAGHARRIAAKRREHTEADIRVNSLARVRREIVAHMGGKREAAEHS